ncbi:hypothetical protein GYMLUDRAFT_107649, partial [Collybiopsis luxurians FD-317 M1]
VSAILEDVGKDLEDYGTEIDRLEGALASLKAKRDQLEEYAAHVRSLKAPVRKIPDEVLCSIFDEC